METAESSLSEHADGGSRYNDETDPQTPTRDSEDRLNAKNAAPTSGSASVYVSMAIVFTMIAVTAGVVLGLTFSFLSADAREDFEHGVSTSTRYGFSPGCGVLWLRANPFCYVMI